MKEIQVRRVISHIYCTLLLLRDCAPALRTRIKALQFTLTYMVRKHFYVKVKEGEFVIYPFSTRDKIDISH
jgi:hypothetical protein